MFHKINGTFINIATESQTSIYEYDNFPPIPFLAGDILGVFVPRDRDSKLRIWHEQDNGPTNYYIPTENSDSVSPFDTIDLQSIPSLMSQVYHPLVTVEISKFLVYKLVWFVVFCYCKSPQLWTALLQAPTHNWSSPAPWVKQAQEIFLSLPLLHLLPLMQVHKYTILWWQLVSSLPHVGSNVCMSHQLFLFFSCHMHMYNHSWSPTNHNWNPANHNQCPTNHNQCPTNHSQSPTHLNQSPTNCNSIFCSIFSFLLSTSLWRGKE